MYLAAIWPNNVQDILCLCHISTIVDIHNPNSAHPAKSIVQGDTIPSEQEKSSMFYFGVMFLHVSLVPLSPLTSSTAAHESQVVESGDLVFDSGRGVAELGRVILIIPRHHGH